MAVCAREREGEKVVRNSVTYFMNSPRAYISVQLITICAVCKSKCAVEAGNVCTIRRAEILVKGMILAPITRFCADVNPA